MSKPVTGMLAVGGLVRKIMALGRVFSAREADLLAPHGLTPAQRDALVALKSHGPSTLSGLARARGYSRQNARALVAALNSRGFVEMHPNPEHRRAPLAAISDQGRETLQAIMHAEGRALAVLAEFVDGSEAREALAVLEKLRPATSQDY